MTNKQPTYLNYAAISELRDQLEAKDQMIKELKKQVEHLSKTQARQFRDNQNLQLKAETARNVVDLDKEKQINKYKDLFHSCKIVLLGYRFRETKTDTMLVVDDIIKQIDEVLK